MRGDIWSEPVVVGDHLIFTPHQAHRFLRDQRHDPNNSSSAVEGALIAAIDGRCDVEVARDMFLERVRLTQC